MSKALFCALVFGGCALILAAPGCAGPHTSPDQRIELLLNQKRLLEEEVRGRDLRIAELSGQPSTATQPQKPHPAPQQDPFRAVALRFGRHTAATSTDGKPGQNQIKIILEPLDAEGDVVKRAGRCKIEILTGPAGKAKRIGQWEFSTLEMSRNWLTGPLGLYAYVLRLPIAAGTQGTVTVKARFTTLDGRSLIAETTIKVKLGKK